MCKFSAFCAPLRAAASGEGGIVNGRAMRVVIIVLIGLAVLAYVLFVAPLPQRSEEPPESAPPSPTPTLQKNPPGRWAPVRQEGAETTDSSLEEMEERMLAMGYMPGTQPAPLESGVVVYHKARACNGYSLYCSGHAPEAVLMDMEGNVLHTWHRNFLDVWPGHPQLARTLGAQFWRRVYVYPNGGLLAIFERNGIVRLDRDSRVLWAHLNQAHHDIHVDKEGLIRVLVREARDEPDIDEDNPIIDDAVVTLDAEGNEMDRVSVLDAFRNSYFSPCLRKLPHIGDIFHTNTIEVLDGRQAARCKAFAQGNYLVSSRELDLVAVINPELDAVVWALTGMWRGQHEPTLLETGNMLIFDNLGLGKRSRVLEFDPISQNVSWAYNGTDEHPLFSFACGASHRLPNGNTLIVETDNGRAIEVTPNGTVVWEFVNPRRAGEDDELIASLFDVVRLRPDFPVDWTAQGTAAQ